MRQGLDHIDEKSEMLAVENAHLRQKVSVLEGEVAKSKLEIEYMKYDVDNLGPFISKLKQEIRFLEEEVVDIIDDQQAKAGQSIHSESPQQSSADVGEYEPSEISEGTWALTEELRRSQEDKMMLVNQSRRLMHELSQVKAERDGYQTGVTNLLAECRSLRTQLEEMRGFVNESHEGRRKADVVKDAAEGLLRKAAELTNQSGRGHGFQHSYGVEDDYTDVEAPFYGYSYGRLRG